MKDGIQMPKLCRPLRCSDVSREKHENLKIAFQEFQSKPSRNRLRNLPEIVGEHSEHFETLILPNEHFADWVIHTQNKVNETSSDITPSCLFFHFIQQNPPKSF
jgi:hypothetical protein